MELSLANFIASDNQFQVMQNSFSRRASFAALTAGMLPLLPEGLKGNLGGASSVAANIFQLKAAAIANTTMLYDGATFNWTTGDYTTTPADDIDVNVIKADSAELSVGAWVRQSGASVTFSQLGTPAIVRDFASKMREFTSVKDFRGDDTTAFQAAVDSGARRILVPRGEYHLETVLIATDGLTLEGESDYGSSLRAIGSGPIFQIGDSSNNAAQHVTLRNFSYGATPSFTGTALIRAKRCFQTYLERLRYKDSSKSPTEAIIVLDNNGGTSEQPVRVTVRDCYFDGADYSPSPGAPAPIAIWNTGGVQVIVDNTHIQDCEIGCKLGTNPAVDAQYYNPKHPNEDDWYDFHFVNNSRYQVGDRGGTTTNARAFDVWKGSGVNVANSQFYLNNNGPNPALARQRVAVFHGTFGMFTMSQSVVNCNARSEYIFKLTANSQVKRLAVSSSEFGGLVGSKGLIEMIAGATCQAVVAPDNVFDNANNFGPVDQRTNIALSPYDLGTANNHYFINSDGADREFSLFRNGTIGVNYVIQFEITGGSVTLTTAAANSTTGIVMDGFQAGSVPLQDGDVLLVTRGPLAAAEYYRAKLIRGGALAMSAGHFVPQALPADAQAGWVVFDSQSGKLKCFDGTIWHNLF
jgi:hypothetical protein